MNRRRREPEPTPQPQPQNNNLLLVIVLVVFVLLMSGGKVNPPTPDPVNPVVAGKRIVVVLFESQAQSPEFSRLRISLQAGEAKAYIKQKGHDVYFFDEQQKDASGSILPVIGYLKSNAGGKKLPAVFVCESIDGKLGKVVHVESITTETTADNVVEYIRRGGG